MSNKKRNTIITLSVVISIIMLAFVMLPQSQIEAIPQIKETKFIITGWDYPDDYGQGVQAWSADTNHTGSWINYAWGIWTNDSVAVKWNVSQAIRMRINVVLNSTFLGISTLAQGENLLRHNVSVTDQFDDVVFSQQNLTLYSNVTGYPDSSMYVYYHYVIFDFLPLEGEFYTVTIICEIYY